MQVLYIIAIIMNTLTILFFSLGLAFKIKNIKPNVMLGYLIAFGLLICIILNIVICLLNIYFSKYLNSFILVILSIIPFIIGYKVKFETLRLYTVLQILNLLINLSILNYML